jgi:hypothetical protein
MNLSLINVKYIFNFLLYRTITRQAVIIAVYCFGMITLMARNFSNPQNSSHVVSGYLPLMPGMQVRIWELKFTGFYNNNKKITINYFSFKFFVYLAWLSFGRAAVNPFGDDEDDIDVKQLLQSHFEVILNSRLNYFQIIATLKIHSFLGYSRLQQIYKKCILAT